MAEAPAEEAAEQAVAPVVEEGRTRKGDYIMIFNK